MEIPCADRNQQDAALSPETPSEIPRALFSCSSEACAAEVSYYADELYWYAAEKRWVCEDCWDDLPCPTDADGSPTRGVTLAEYVIGGDFKAVMLLHNHRDDAGQKERTMNIANRDLLAIAEWLTGGDTGISSQYMAAVAIAGKVTESRWGDPTPSDAPDLGRCVRLVEKVPFLRKTFPVLREASPVWAAYLNHWEELVALYQQGNYTATTARMRDLRASANDQAQRPLDHDA